jgi:hypothetical protein
MIGEPAESPRLGAAGQDREAGEREGAGRRGRAQEHKRAGERFGPLTMTRRVKDDGRALILYARAPEERG